MYIKKGGEKLNLLLTNDDGVNAIGVRKLAKALSKKHNVIIVAPNSNCSGFSQSLTVRKTITFKKTAFDDGIESYTVCGTPADCVKIAHHLLKDFKIDAVISGINDGFNLGTDVFYSGTVAAATEGAILGYKAIAFSIPYDAEEHIDFYAQKSADFVDELLNFDNTVWNVNFPDCNPNEIKGVKFTPVGVVEYSDRYEKTGENSYFLTGELIRSNKNEPDCDSEHILNGFITISPISTDKTDYKILKTVQK